MLRGRLFGCGGILLVLSAVLAGCGGGGGGGDASGAAGYAVSGTLSGYSGSGLVLRLNSGGGTLAVGAGGINFAFSGVASNTTYAISVATHPSAPAQTCTVASGEGTVTNANITNVQVSCVTNTRTISGSVSGLVALGLALRNNGADDLAVGASNFTFPTPVAEGSAYSVTILSQPTGQTCNVTSGGGGTVAGVNVTSVLVACANNVRPPSTFTIGGLISGVTGSGLVLRNNGADSLSFNPASGVTAFTFNTAIPDLSAYNVTVFAQPTGQACTVSGGGNNNGGGSVAGASVSNILVSCADVPTYNIGGTVTGLTGTGLVLQNNGADNRSITGNGGFFFATKLANSATYSVSVLAQPSGQTCNIASATGTVASANVSNVQVNCAANTFTISGSVSGLSGTVVVQNNLGDSRSISTNSAFTFATPFSSGSLYSVTVLTQPTGQFCSVTNGSGTVASANITNVSVTCVANPYNVGGTVSGLGGTVVLQNNLGDNKSVSADGAFAFGTKILHGNAYSVTVLTQPAGQTCTVAGGSGNVSGADVANVLVSCVTNSYTIGGSVSGLVGTGAMLQNNGGDNRSISANGPFTFATSVLNGLNYSVTVLTQPAQPAQTCTIAAGSGTVATANVTSVLVTCSTNIFTVSGTVSGLTGSGLVLQNNGADSHPISTDGAVNFTAVASGSPYSVTVLTQPTGQTCTVTAGSGTVTNANISNVQVGCTNNPKFTVGGSVSGLTGTLVLRNNGGDNLSIGVNGAYAFGTSLFNGDGYNVSVLTQPVGQTCNIANATGTVPNANVTNVQVSCAGNPYTIGGTVSGLNGTVVLQDNLLDNFSISGNGPFTFVTPVSSGNAYNVTVLNQPTGQTCTVAGGGGTVAGANVASVLISCVTNSYAIRPTVSGLVGTVVLQNNLGDNKSVSANGQSSFTTPILHGSGYSVTVLTQPSTQTCTVTSGSGTVSGADVTSVQVNCVTNTFTISGNVSGLTGTVVLQNNGADNLSISANGAFSFTTAVASGLPYSVTVLTQPTAQTCTVTAGSGTATANVTNVQVACAINTYTISGSVVSGLISGRLLILQNNGADNLSISANGAFAFNTAVASGQPYSVTILTQPPGQNCNVANGSGTVAAVPITNVQVTCSVITYTISGNVSAPPSGGPVSPIPGGLTLQSKVQNVVVDNLSISNYGPFTFPTKVQSGASYAVVVSPPAGWTCVAVRAAGVVGVADITDVQISCIDNVVAATGSMGAARAHHSATLLAGGKVLVGGGSNSAVLQSAEIFDPAGNGGAGAFAATGSLGAVRSLHTATLLPSGKVLLAGGVGTNNIDSINTAEIFDPSGNSGAGTFSATGSMGKLRLDHAAVALGNGTVLVTGGCCTGGFVELSTEIFDPAANGGAGVFTATADMTTARKAHSATLLNGGTVLIAGGKNDDTLLSSAEVYNPVAGTFTATLGPMNTARRGHTATRLSNGKVLIVGGEGDSNNPLSSAEVYDPATGLFTPTGTMATPRRHHTATLLANGRVLIAGGLSTSAEADTLATTETYDPVSGFFSRSGSMGLDPNGLHLPRAYHGATLLPGPNKVLFTGGFVDGVNVTNTAHLFTPQ